MRQTMKNHMHSHFYPRCWSFLFFVELCKIIRKWNDVSRAVSTNSCFKTKLITIDSKMIYYPVFISFTPSVFYIVRFTTQHLNSCEQIQDTFCHGINNIFAGDKLSLYDGVITMNLVSDALEHALKTSTGHINKARNNFWWICMEQEHHGWNLVCF